MPCLKPSNHHFWENGKLDKFENWKKKETKLVKWDGIFKKPNRKTKKIRLPILGSQSLLGTVRKIRIHFWILCVWQRLLRIEIIIAGNGKSISRKSSWKWFHGNRKCWSTLCRMLGTETICNCDNIHNGLNFKLINKIFLT